MKYSISCFKRNYRNHMGHKIVYFLEAAITRVKFYSLLSSNEANKS